MEPQPASFRFDQSSRHTTTATALTVGVTGATGFVGRAICRTLLDHGHRVRALVRGEKKAGLLPRPVECRHGSLFDDDDLARFTGEVDAVIHLVGIIFQRPRREQTFARIHVEATENIVRACEAAGVSRYLHMSALGARPHARSDYHQTKFEAEEIVRRSQLAWTIVRPSMIHGPHGEFTDMMASWSRGTAPPFVFMPYFGAGPVGLGHRYRIQPVHVNDVAEVFCQALTQPGAVREVLPLGGADAITWPDMLTTFRDALPGTTRYRPAVAIPAWKAGGMARFFEAIGLHGLLPFNSAQVLMSQEDSVCDLTRVREILGIEPQGFADSLAGYVSTL